MENRGSSDWSGLSTQCNCTYQTTNQDSILFKHAKKMQYFFRSWHFRTDFERLRCSKFHDYDLAVIM